MKKIFLIFFLSFILSGCLAQKSVTIREVVLLPEDRIYTVPAGQKIDVLLDNKPLAMTFPSDMKLVSPTTLVRQEIKLNNETLAKIKAEGNTKKIAGIAGSLLAAISGIFAWLNSKKKKE